ncbi:MAG: hypothetical protein U5R06_18640 [candidate division KSB1 bacterium]|nr:hypothetical protein [candidate division KSB1 bacterium]
MLRKTLCLILVLVAVPLLAYENFNTAIYSRVYETIKMGDLDWLEPRFDVMQEHIEVDKVYLETHRDMVVVDQETLDRVKQFFHDRGVKTSGGITITVDEGNRFETYCYTNPEHRKKLKEVIEFTARNFDEVILDDFFFTNCKCESCIKAKGDRSWPEFRLQLLTEVARDLILKPARKVNPDVSVIVKYPNWYEHFQGCGFNLETQPALFDGLYTGTETRDPGSHQHLQPYQGYQIVRYFENLKPDGNLGGWVDTGGLRFLDRYAEQLWLTLFAKAPEQTLFDFRQLQYPIRREWRADWQGSGSSFDFDEMMAPFLAKEGNRFEDATVALAAGYTFEKIDPIIGELGTPVAVPSYKPFHSTGEDFLQNYLGMIGIPVHLVPEFPMDSDMLILTETAKHDPNIVEKMKARLINGKDIVITSGLVNALQDNGLEDIVELRYTPRKALVDQFRAGWRSMYSIDESMLIPQIAYLTNDSWEEISAMDGTNGWPLLHSAEYGNAVLYVLTIPESFIDLYRLPVPVLDGIRQTVLPDEFVRVSAPGKVSVFQYDNDTFIVESFCDEPVLTSLFTPDGVSQLIDIETGRVLDGESVTRRFRQVTENRFQTRLNAHSFKAFKMK